MSGLGRSRGRHTKGGESLTPDHISRASSIDRIARLQAASMRRSRPRTKSADLAGACPPLDPFRRNTPGLSSGIMTSSIEMIQLLTSTFCHPPQSESCFSHGLSWHEVVQGHSSEATQYELASEYRHSEGLHTGESFASNLAESLASPLCTSATPTSSSRGSGWLARWLACLLACSFPCFWVLAAQ